MRVKTGGPAFPRPVSINPNDVIEFAAEGMSLRDYFAAKALIPDKVLASAMDTSASEYEALPKLAKWCYAWADAMLSERERAE